MSGSARAAAVGIAQFGLVVVITRAMSVGVQIALGWMLLPQHFGAFALALAVTNIVFSFRECGIGRYLVQRPRELERHHRHAMTTAVVTNAGLALLTTGFARAVASPSSRDVVACIDILALALVVAAPAAVYQAHLAVGARFSTLARLSAASAAVRYAVTIGMAAAGVGATSLAWGALAAAVFDTASLRVSGRSIGRDSPDGPSGPTTRDFIRAAAGPGLWIGISTLAIAVQTQGDNLVVGWITDPVKLGVYFFAYQLTVAVSSVFTVGFSNILLPSLATVEEGPARRDAVERVLRMTGTLGPPVAVAAAFLLPEVIVAVWGTKWQGAARPAEILALTVGTRLLTPVSMAVYQAQGRWKTGAYVGLVDGAVIVGAAAVGAWQGNVVTVALAVGAARSVASSVESGMAAAVAGLPAVRTMVRTCTPSVVTVLGAAPWFLYRTRYVGLGGDLPEKAVLAAGLATTLVGLHAILYGSTWRQFAGLLRRPVAASPR